ncbi:hypothetical protein MRX96_044499 [Rhipicephalus microplus]
MEAKRTVLVDAEPDIRSDFIALELTLRSPKPTWICPSLLYAAFFPVDLAKAKNLRFILSPCYVFGVLEIKGAHIKNAAWPLTSSVSHNPSAEEILSNLRIESTKVKRLSGERLTVACFIGHFYGGGKHSCDHQAIEFLLGCLRQTNVSLNIIYIPIFGSVRRDTAYSQWDILFLSAKLDAEIVLDADIPHVEMIQETFYSRINDDRIVTLSEVVYDSKPLIASTLALLLAVALVLAKMENCQLPPLVRITDSVTLLLASVLATSAPLPGNVSRRVISGVALYYPLVPCGTSTILLLPQ